MKSLRVDRVPTHVTVDGVEWLERRATCVLVGNLDTIARARIHELDGGDRDAVDHFEIAIQPSATELCVPAVNPP